MRHLVLTFFCLFLFVACNQSQGHTDSNPSDPSQGNTIEKGNISENANSKTRPKDIITLSQRQVIDREGTKMVASTYLLPSDWTVDDKLYWEYGDATLPIRFKAKMQSSDGTMSIQIFPDVRAVWASGPTGVSGYQPPKDIISGMKDLIKAERKDKNIKYVNQKIIANNSQNTPQGRTTAQSGVINVEYEENGNVYEEEFYAKLDIASQTTPSAYGNMQGIVWAASGLYACKAIKGKLEDCRKIAQTVASSARLTKPFYNRLAQVIKLLSDQVYAQIYQAGQISKIISQTNDQMIANIDASYHQSQQAYDHANNQFSDYIRGVDRYDNGGSEIQLPSGYENAWVNDRGEYLLTNTSGYDPGTDFNGNWKQLQRQN